MNNRCLLVLFLLILSLANASFAFQKPNVWIFTDMTDKRIPGKNKEGTVNDPDDISAMAGYFLMSNYFNTLGVVVGSTHRKEHVNTPDQAVWADQVFNSAFQKDRPNLQKAIGNYPTKIDFIQSSILKTAEKFDGKKNYRSIEAYSSLQAFLSTAREHQGLINILCWGSLTEPAILVKHLLRTKQQALLQRLRFIAHWTNSPLHQGTPARPWKVANCNEDLRACRFLKKQALNGRIKFYELGAIGQHGIVSDAISGEAFNNQFNRSALGRLFRNGKFAHNQVDHSDAATYWTLIGTYGVSLGDVRLNGVNSAAIEKKNSERFKAQAKAIQAELLRRSNIAAGLTAD